MEQDLRKRVINLKTFAQPLQKVQNEPSFLKLCFKKS
jgi:hypothetical protein